MKACTTILIPITLSLMISACSTSSRQQTESAITPETSNTETSSQSSAISAKNDELEKDIVSKEALILSLQQQLADNKKQLVFVNQSLDEKDKIIASMQKTSSGAESLATLEEHKKAREILESTYTALKLANDLLNRTIKQIKK